MPVLPESRRLQKKLRLFHVYAVSTGAMFSSGFFLLPGLAAAKTGPSVVLAYFLAGVLMVPAMVSKAELCTAMPRAGGTYYFLDRSLGPLVGTVAGLGTWLVMTLKSAFALIGMGAYLTLYLELPVQWVAVALTVAFTVLNLVGVKETIGVQVGLIVTVLAVLGLFLVEGSFELLRRGSTEPLAAAFSPFFTHGAGGFFATVGFVVVSFAGLTKVASVAEEVQDPERNIPRAMFLSLGTAVALYVVGITLMLFFLPGPRFYGDLAPVATAARAFMDWIPTPYSVLLIVVAAIAGFSAAGNAALMSASRYPLAMARDRLAPELFARVSPRFGTPVRSVLLTGGLMVAFIVVLSVEGVAKLASSLQLLLFGLVNLAVIVMRESRIDSYDPGYRSPLYPWTQLVGIAACGWLMVEIGVPSMLFTTAVVVLSVGWFLVYARDRVEREGALYHIFERLGRRRFEGLDRELRGILKEKGLREEDPFDEVVARAFVVEAAAGATFEELARRAGELLAARLPGSGEELARGFLEGTRMGATPVSHGAALPHVRVDGAEHPEMVLVRSREGIELVPEGEREEAHGGGTVHAFFFLASPERDPAQHLRLLAQIAGRVDDDDFLGAWLHAPHEAKLKEVLLRDERFVLLRLEAGSRAAAELAGRAVRDLDLPPGCLIALVRRREDGTLVPSGSTVLEEGDRVTVLGDPAGIDVLYRRYVAS